MYDHGINSEQFNQNSIVQDFRCNVLIVVVLIETIVIRTMLFPKHYQRT